MLRRLPRGTSYQPRMIRRVEVQRAGTGGARLTISHPGDHWAIEVDAGVMALMDARELIADIMMATANPVRLPWPQRGLDVGAPGAEVVVAGAGQAGSTIALSGFTPHYLFRKGQFLTIETSGSGRLYMASAPAVADGAGAISLQIWPMLHVQPQDGDPVEVAEPFIEGTIDEGGDHETGLMPAGELNSFTIEEQS